MFLQEQFTVVLRCRDTQGSKLISVQHSPYQGDTNYALTSLVTTVIFEYFGAALQPALFRNYPGVRWIYQRKSESHRKNTWNFATFNF